MPAWGSPGESAGDAVVEDGWTPTEAAAASGVSVQSVRKLLQRFRAEGPRGLQDRSSRPHHSPRQLPRRLERRIVGLRQPPMTGPRIADAVGLSLSTVGDVLRGPGLRRLPPPPPAWPPIVRYERAQPRELLHIDAKKLGRIVVVGHRITGDRSVRGPRRRTGWETLRVAADDCSRVAYAELLPDESAASSDMRWRSCAQRRRRYPTFPEVVSRRVFASVSRSWQLPSPYGHR